MLPMPSKADAETQARHLHHLLLQASVATASLVNALSTGLKDPILKAAHRCAHRIGHPAKIAADAELQAFINARLDTMTFDQITKEVAANFPPERRVSISTIHRWWQKSKQS